MSRRTGMQTRKWFTLFGALFLWGGLVCGTSLPLLATDDQPAKASPAASPQAESPPADKQKQDAAPRKKIVNRLPNNFGKLGLTESQRQKIYALQAKYRAQLEALTAQIEALREEQNQEIESVLTPAQKAELHKFQQATQNKRASPPATTDTDTDS